MAQPAKPSQPSARALRASRQISRICSPTSSVPWSSELLAEIIDRETKAPEMYELLSKLLEMAESYLAKAPSHPDNAVLEDARRIKAEIDGKD